MHRSPAAQNSRYVDQGTENADSCKSLSEPQRQSTKPSALPKHYKLQNSHHRGLPKTQTQAQRRENGRKPPSFFIKRRKQHAAAGPTPPNDADNTKVSKKSVQGKWDRFCLDELREDPEAVMQNLGPAEIKTFFDWIGKNFRGSVKADSSFSNYWRVLKGLYYEKTFKTLDEATIKDLQERSLQENGPPKATKTKAGTEEGSDCGKSEPLTEDHSIDDAASKFDNYDTLAERDPHVLHEEAVIAAHRVVEWERTNSSANWEDIKLSEVDTMCDTLCDDVDMDVDYESDISSVTDDGYLGGDDETRTILWRHISFRIVRNPQQGMPNLLIAIVSLVNTKGQDRKPRVKRFVIQHEDNPLFDLLGQLVAMAFHDEVFVAEFKDIEESLFAEHSQPQKGPRTKNQTGQIADTEAAKYPVLYLELPEAPVNPPKITTPAKDPPVNDPPVVAKGYFAKMWGFDPTISTTREANFAEGFSASGNQIMRYKAFFTPSEKKQKEGKKPTYQVLTFQEPKDGMPAQWRLESGSDVGEDAVEAYVKNSNALKMNEYYGEKVMQIKYSKEFFAKYHTEFLYALRKSDRTKSGRTMPPEYCILGFNYNGKQWWDLFSRSAYGNFWGHKRAGIRIDQWWTERGEEPSYRLELEGGPKSSSVPMSGYCRQISCAPTYEKRF
ncbi:hypothetical protein TSTA_102130 [Talaromyces stipitatus ATCC 10500]|uniref:Uncharacterized protein n=1 Tax=Talaromyces stipitatus (strain ATCC 10500 / CBS 375.48 / QM 6759 / NRRL 1006) TaxID=441959 RepID=B8MN34_TALSN|nr:uncharacterized protein TSTA_102130 [Talaromyces stipitatus ATCC 10500]EED13983.1 hypothetical protein TSTA_102130 [Talaromyces stipitatus ATCC 10500]